jgi:DNA-binding CsgD family transcriptional regulator
MRMSTLTDLPVRQREVALLVADELTNGEIAERLFIAEQTVKTHMSELYRTLGIAGTDGNRRMQVARWVWEQQRPTLSVDAADPVNRVLAEARLMVSGYQIPQTAQGTTLGLSVLVAEAAVMAGRSDPKRLRIQLLHVAAAALAGVLAHEGEAG